MRLTKPNETTSNAGAQKVALGDLEEVRALGFGLLKSPVLLVAVAGRRRGHLGEVVHGIGWGCGLGGDGGGVLLEIGSYDGDFRGVVGDVVRVRGFCVQEGGIGVRLRGEELKSAQTRLREQRPRTHLLRDGGSVLGGDSSVRHGRKWGRVPFIVPRTLRMVYEGRVAADVTRRRHCRRASYQRFPGVPFGSFDPQPRRRAGVTRGVGVGELRAPPRRPEEEGGEAKGAPYRHDQLRRVEA